jgi:sugar/nucleoside kinase (ribokinase family)
MPSILIAGGLTIDVFADGRRAPGGSVIHAGIAAVADGASVATLTVAGSEPEAAAGRAHLEALGTLLAGPAPATTTFGHGETNGRRVLVLEVAGGQVPAHPEAASGRPDVVLFAPIADELDTQTVRTVCETAEPRIAAFLIQGWLRHLAVGEVVRPLPLAAVGTDLWGTFGAGDLVVVSIEDLAEGVAEDPFAMGATLRSRIGPRPVLVVTLGTEGYLLDDPRADRITAVVPRRVVRGVPTVGAGDTFGVVMALRLAAGATPAAAADSATDAVISLLESRR